MRGPLILQTFIDISFVLLQSISRAGSNSRSLLPPAPFHSLFGPRLGQDLPLQSSILGWLPLKGPPSLSASQYFPATFFFYYCNTGQSDNSETAYKKSGRGKRHYVSVACHPGWRCVKKEERTGRGRGRGGGGLHSKFRSATHATTKV